MPNMLRVRYVFSKDSTVLNNKGCCVLQASSTFRVCWDSMLFLCLIYISIITPFRIGFEQHPPHQSTWWYVELYIDVVFVVDLVLNFRTTYFEKGKEVIDGKQIAKNYLKTWFLIDLISSIPFDTIFEYFLGLEMNSSMSNVGNVQATKTFKISKKRM